MAFHKDFAFEVQGDEVTYRQARSIAASSLPPNQGLSLRFTALEGSMGISVTSLDRLETSRTHTVGGDLDANGTTEDGPGSTVEEFNSVAAVIELFAPGQHTRVARFEVAPGFSETETFEFEHNVASPAPKGEWEVRITNRDNRTANVELTVLGFTDREQFRKESLATRLLDHAYLVILEALQPSVRLHGNSLTISFGDDVRDLIGSRDTAGDLAPIDIQLPSGSITVEAEGRMTSFDLRARSGRALLDAVLTRFAAVKASTEFQIEQLAALNDSASLVKRQNLRNALASNLEFRREWEERVHPDDAVIQATTAFSTTEVVVTADVGPFEVAAEGVVGEITADVYIAFDHRLERCNVLALAPQKTIDIKANNIPAALARALGIVPNLNAAIESDVPSHIEKVGPLLGRFLGEAVGRLASRDSVFHSLTASESNWVVQYTAIPGGPAPVVADGEGTVHTTTLHPDTHSSIGGGGGTVNTHPDSPAPTPDSTLGVFPDETKFVVVKPETLERLDKIDHLVFVMMENRSFDHILGYLRAERGPQYEGLHGGESNRVVGRTQPVHMRPARDIVPEPITQIPISPNHDFEPVGEQIDGGKMSGFAQDFENRHPGFAELVMTFYSSKEMKVYDELAADYSVCDHWYCAHAGPTFPNRFVTLTGATPVDDNQETDDPSLGFLPERTIFDLLRDIGVDWAVYESDLSLIRMFNRFRLNANQIRPFVNRVDGDQSFVKVAARGELPPVVFVEPNFVDIPPIITATDDHPPADLRRGQNFIGSIVEALRSSPEHWARTMLVITYDEHGGFYDHVPPPGTALGNLPPEFSGGIPSISPTERTFMGPRVPSFVISPMVKAGSVCQDVVDHTSIIKTILLRHRRKIPTRVFTQFGPRVDKICHLGVALNLDEPRDDPPRPVQRMPLGTTTSEVGAAPLFSVLPAPTGPDDFHESLRRAPLPKRK